MIIPYTPNANYHIRKHYQQPTGTFANQDSRQERRGCEQSCDDYRKESLKVINILDLGKAFHNKASFILIQISIQLVFASVYLTTTNNGSSNTALTKFQISRENRTYISSMTFSR